MFDLIYLLWNTIFKVGLDKINLIFLKLNLNYKIKKKCIVIFLILIIKKYIIISIKVQDIKKLHFSIEIFRWNYSCIYSDQNSNKKEILMFSQGKIRKIFTILTRIYFSSFIYNELIHKNKI